MNKLPDRGIRGECSQFPEAVLEIDGLCITYATEDGTLNAVRSVSLTVHRGETMGLVGESGSGKSTLVMGAIGYLARNGCVSGGSTRLLGEELTSMSPKLLRRLWGSRIGVVYQNPLTALSPTIRIGKQLAEVGRVHLGIDASQARNLALDMLTKVAMPDPENILERYPHQVSGGMLQRCVIAMALMARPALLIMDEPTTALDVTTQAVVLDLLAELRTQYDCAIVYITHDLGVVAKICHSVAVMYAGELMEKASLRDTFTQPLHPYTKALLSCVPTLDAGHVKEPLSPIGGRIPRLNELPVGCIFSPRCEHVTDACRESRPRLERVGPDRWTACIQYDALPAPSTSSSPLPSVARTGRVLRDANPLLELRDLTKHYHAVEGGPPFGRRDRRVVHALDSTSVTVGRGQTLGIVGESGCGKTTLARVIIGLAPATSGRALLDGEELPPSLGERTRDAVKRIQMVFQNPDATLNPHRSIGAAIARPMRLLRGVRGEELRRQSLQLLESVHLPSGYYDRRPSELSQGERQRVAIARAFAADPDLVLCDEPISSLDVSVQGAVMNLLLAFQAERGTAYLFISHDISAVQRLSDVIAVMYLGHVVEWGTTEKVMEPPFHPYTEALMSAVPEVRLETAASPAIRLNGSVPTPLDVPPGCRFHPRCPRCLGEVCSQREPPWSEEDGHLVCCHIPLDSLREFQSAGDLGAFQTREA